VLENHHCAKTFEMLFAKENNCNILANLSTDRYRSIRASILSLVLSTDMANHFENLGRFQNKVSGNGRIIILIQKVYAFN